MKQLKLILLFTLMLGLSGCGPGYLDRCLLHDFSYCFSPLDEALGFTGPMCSKVIDQSYQDYIIKCKGAGGQCTTDATTEEIYRAWEKCEAKCPSDKAVLDFCCRSMKESGYFKH